MVTTDRRGGEWCEEFDRAALVAKKTDGAALRVLKARDLGPSKIGAQDRATGCYEGREGLPAAQRSYGQDQLECGATAAVNWKET